MYLIPNDYTRQIQTVQLNALSTSNSAVVKALELTVQEEVCSYLVQKYDTSMEFTDTVPWDISTAYKALRRVYLFAAAYSATSTYALNALTLQAGNVYRCTTPITVPEVFTLSNWTLLGTQYQIFYVKAPQPVWDAKTYFATGSSVWWKDKVYPCINANSGYEPGTQAAVSYWGSGTDFSISAGVLPTNTTYWEAADNRSQQLVTYMVNMVIYYLSKRIAPNNVPQMAVDAYDLAKEWLKSIAGMKDGVTANLPRLQPTTTGQRTRMASSQTRNQNFY